MANFLKRLELNGFKSFAGKTVLEFPAGITAIVGPNGCGKSNIVDAIRWLLGERETKNLRGAKAEDLIFAGTPKRARVGLAQASLHFENKNKFFPVEFAEVSIMREVGRDGAGRYFMNKSEILLRDLIDFLARARLGSRGLAVITQGNSDVFIQASPKIRREMIEEALGLREYQIKKADAERRLKTSEINLDKAKALIQEILPHLRSLKRQTNRWEKRESLEQELKELENQFFGRVLRDFRVRISSVNAEIESERAKLNVLEKEKSSAEEHKKKVETSQPEENKELKQIRETTREMLERRSILGKELGRLEAQLEIFIEEAGQPVSHSAEVLLKFINNIRERLGSVLEKEIDELRGVLKNAISEMDEFLASGKPAKEKPNRESAIKIQLEKINNDLEILRREMAVLKEKEKVLEKSQEEFYRDFKAAVEAVESVGDKIRRWEGGNQERMLQKERLETQFEELERQIAQTGRRLEEFEEVTISAAAKDESGSTVEKRILRLRGELASIGEIDESLMKEAKETESRYEFLSREAEDLEGARKDLSQLIKELTEKINREFSEAITKINAEFSRYFEVMFGGGHAKFRLSSRKPKMVDETVDGEEGKTTASPAKEVEEEEESGIEIEVKLPRKRLESLEALSGGERSLVGIAAVFALISVSPPPFLVLDEIDAALDERNARRFAEMLKELSAKSQFIVVTHNRATMEAADILYGVTLSEDGSSRILSLKLEKQSA